MQLIARGFLNAVIASAALSCAGESESPAQVNVCPAQVLDTPVHISFTQPPALLNRRSAIQWLEKEVSRVDVEVQEASLPVWFLTGVDGSVLDVRLDRSTGSAGLDSAILRAAGRFRFTPAYQDTTPVCFWMRMYVPSTAPR